MVFGSIDWNKNLSKYFFDLDKNKSYYYSVFNSILTGHQQGKSIEQIYSKICNIDENLNTESNLSQIMHQGIEALMNQTDEE